MPRSNRDREVREAATDKAPPPPVPVPDKEMFTGILGEIAHAADPGTEADIVGIYASLLGIAGTLIGNRPHARIGNRQHPLLVWPLLIGRTGAGRKGDAVDTAELIFSHSHPNLSDLTITGISTGEGLIWHVHDPVYSPDGEYKSGTDEKRLFVSEDELGHVIAVASREGAILSSVLRKAWDGRTLQVPTRTNPYKATKPHIGIVAAITPTEFRARVTHRDMASGLWNRFLPLFVERRELIALPEGLGPELLYEFGGRLVKAISKASEFNRIGLSNAARDLWTDKLYPEFADLMNEEGPVADFMERSAPYCRRLSALTGVLKGDRKIGEEDLRAAAALVRYSISSARYVLGVKERDPKLDRLQRAVDEAYPGGLSGEQMRDLFNRNLTKEELQDLADELCSNPEYELAEVHTGRPGRPRKQLRRLSSPYAENAKTRKPRSGG